MEIPETVAKEELLLDRSELLAVAGLSFLALTQLALIEKVDVALKISIFLFIVAIPLLVVAGLICRLKLADERHYKKSFLFHITLMLIAMLLAYGAIVAFIWHVSTSSALVFLGSSFVAFVAILIYGGLNMYEKTQQTTSAHEDKTPSKTAP